MTVKDSSRLRIALQKKGRLYTNSMDLLARCGVKVDVNHNSLFYHSENLPIDLLFVRDDDIPTLIMDEVCDLGIVGENVLLEKQLHQQAVGGKGKFTGIKKLNFGYCRLSIAMPAETVFAGVESLQNLRIATSYPYLLQQYLSQHRIKAQVMQLSGSVEIAPRLEMADAICDLVSTGRTLEENNLREVTEVISSQAMLIQSPASLNTARQNILDLLLNRLRGVLTAEESKYIMFHAPRQALASITQLLPGSGLPTVSPLEGSDDEVAVHVVSSEGVFWETLEKLKAAGASSVLVLPIEKMLY